MVRILAWDTSGRFGVLGAFEIQSTQDASALTRVRSGQLLQVDQKQHSEGLFIAIEETLAACGWGWKDLSAIGVGVGPGSFTGVRVGLTAARTFGQTLGLPLVPISSLKLRATHARKHGEHSGDLALCVEACMGEVYVRQERASASGEFQSEEWVTPVQELSFRALHSEGLWVSPVKYRDLQPAGWSWLSDSSEADTSSLWVEALGQEVVRAFLAGGQCSALDAHPAYLRAPDAELKLRQRLKG